MQGAASSSSSSSSSSAAAASASSSKKRRKQQQQQQQEQECAATNTTSSSSSSSTCTKKKQKKQQEKASKAVPAPEPSTPPTGVARGRGEWPVRQLFPTPPTRRQRASTGAIEGVEPHQSTQVADAQTQTTNQDCLIRECSYVNITYELQAKRNLYDSEPWRKV